MSMQPKISEIAPAIYRDYDERDDKTRFVAFLPGWSSYRWTTRFFPGRATEEQAVKAWNWQRYLFSGTDNVLRDQLPKVKL